jgi:BirA family biotin operon repressor/biotin-[acetyl-CoA-carboxylase] ligase
MAAGGPRGVRLGHPRLHLRSTDSTNERARALAAAGAPHGTLVTAAAQTAGRGRQGRSWTAPPGSSLLMSLLLREPPRLLPLIAAVAVCDATGAETLIKWPNDIVLRRGEQLAKLAGILVEGRPQEGWAVVGIGINVAVRLDELPEDLRGRAATLGHRDEDVEPLLAEVLAALQRRLATPAGEVLGAWSARDALTGRRVEWGMSATAAAGPRSGTKAPRQVGTACGIDGDGRLVVELAHGGRTTLEAGEVHLAAPG